MDIQPSSILTLIIEIVVFITLLSIFVSTVTEIIGSFFNLRSFTLRRSINKMLGRKLSRHFFSHKVIDKLHEVRLQIFAPFSISKETFADVVLDVLDGNPQGKTDGQVLAQISRSVHDETLVDKDERGVLQSLVEHAKSVEDFHIKLSGWFATVGERTSAIYARDMKVVGFFVSVIITILFHLDPVGYFRDTRVKMIQQEIDAKGKQYVNRVMHDQLLSVATLSTHKGNIELSDFWNKKELKECQLPVSVDLHLQTEKKRLYSKIVHWEQDQLPKDQLLLLAASYEIGEFVSCQQLEVLALSQYKVKNTLGMESRGVVYWIFNVLFLSMLLSLGSETWFNFLSRFVKLRSNMVK